MFEGLIEFVEQSVFTLVNQIVEREPGATPDLGKHQSAKIIALLVQFAEKNPGMARVMVGDALVFENERLQMRMNQFFDKIEATLRQCLRASAPSASLTPTVDAQVLAAVLTAFAAGRLQRYVRSGFKRLPSEHLDACLSTMLG
jgi:TetR/AcrR family transcriptional regulator